MQLTLLFVLYCRKQPQKTVLYGYYATRAEYLKENRRYNMNPDEVSNSDKTS